MSENKYFQAALANMVAGSAYIDAVRHMYDAGLTTDEMRRILDYPVSTEKIEKAIRDYEAEKVGEQSSFEFVQKTNEYGRKSFVKVEKKTN